MTQYSGYKKISKEAIPSAQTNKFSNFNKTLETESVEETHLEKNKILNRKNIIILLSLITIVGFGVWYYYYNNGTGGAQTGGGILPPPPPNNDINLFQTGIFIHITEAERAD